MNKIAAFLIVFAVGCGESKKEWVHRVDALIRRAHACTDVPCVKAVMADLAKVDRDKLDAEQLEFITIAQKRIESAEGLQLLLAERAKSPFTNVEMFDMTIRACDIAFNNAGPKGRAALQPLLDRVKMTLRPDQQSALGWYDDFINELLQITADKVPAEDALNAKIAHRICIAYHLYAPDHVREKPEAWETLGAEVARLGKMQRLADNVEPLLARLRETATREEVQAAAKKVLADVRERLVKRQTDPNW